MLAASAPLDDAEAALTAFDAEGALTALADARAAGTFTLPDHVRYFAALGVAHAYLEHEDASLDAFVRLLRLAPGHAIPYTLPPRVTFLFERARKVAGPPPRIDLGWPRGLRTDQPLPLVVEVLDDPRGVLDHARLFWRDDAEASFRSRRVELPPVGRYATVELPAFGAEVTTDRTRQMYLSAFDPSGDERLRVGDATAPLTVAQLAPTPWHSKWWVWTAIGTAVAAGTATAVFVATRSPPETVDVGVRVQRP